MDGQCRQSNVNYSMLCKLCPESNPTEYIGETARNVYTRCREHMKGYKSKKNKTSFFKNHQVKQHAGAEPQFSAKVKQSYRDCLSRQVGEAVAIRRSGKELLNSKSEWHQPPLFRVQSEIING